MNRYKRTRRQSKRFTRKAQRRMKSFVADRKKHAVTIFDNAPSHCEHCGSPMMTCDKPKKVVVKCSSDKCNYEWNEHGFSDSRTRFARNLAHQHFDALWKNKGWQTYGHRVKERHKRYAHLARYLNLDTHQTHIGAFDYDTCMRVIEFCNTQQSRSTSDLNERVGTVERQENMEVDR